MSIRKKIIIKFFILLLLTSAILTSCGGKHMDSTKTFNQFLELIEQERLNDVTLTIYYKNPFAFTRQPLSFDDLVYGITAVNEPSREKNDINGLYEHKIVVDSNRLEEHIDLLNQMSSTTLIPVEKESYLNTRIYYVFETEKNGKVFDVAMWGGDDEYSIFVNGVEVKVNDIFYDVIMPFLPKEVAGELERFIGR